MAKVINSFQERTRWTERISIDFFPCLNSIEQDNWKTCAIIQLSYSSIGIARSAHLDFNREINMLCLRTLLHLWRTNWDSKNVKKRINQSVPTDLSQSLAFLRVHVICCFPITNSVRIKMVFLCIFRISLVCRMLESGIARSPPATT